MMSREWTKQLYSKKTDKELRDVISWRSDSQRIITMSEDDLMRMDLIKSVCREILKERGKEAAV